MTDLDFLRAGDASHLDGEPAVYCMEGQRGDFGIVRRGELVHRGHPSVKAAPWAFSSEQPTDLSSPELDRVDRDPDDDQEQPEDDEPVEPTIPYGPYPEFPELEPVEELDLPDSRKEEPWP